MTRIGKVFLVGAGPGDPGLFTLRGVESLQQAEVVVYDYLASPVLLNHAAQTAERIYVGKKGGNHTLSQEGINALLVQKALAGKVVVRLKGGDPFVFGRGGEEIEALAAAGIPFEVVPGVTSAIAAPAYAGIPLTHRKYTPSVAFVTGHEDPAKEASLIDWPALATGIGTVVFVMGVKNLPRITDQLMAHGRSGDTPVALIRWGTTPRQRSLTGTLATIATKAREAGFKAPAVIVVGEVVSLRQTMNWFESRPLMGRCIVVTRARAQSSDLIHRLTQLGAECLECPTIRVVPPDDYEPLRVAVDNLESYDWLVFTSVNGVKYFFQCLFAQGYDVRALKDIRTACIGPATADALRGFGLTSDIVPESYRAESVLRAFSREVMTGRRVLLPRASEARPILPQELTRMGARVDEIAAYRTLPDQEGAQHLMERLQAAEVDMVTFTSSSTARNFKALLSNDAAQHLMRNVAVASIGPITTETARKLGFTVDLEAQSYTIPGLIDAIRHYYLNSKSSFKNNVMQASTTS